MEPGCSDVWPPLALGYFTFIASVLTAICAFTGNGLVGILVLIDPLKTLRTPVNYFLLNLAFSDMVVACVTLPMSAYMHYQEIVGVKPASNVSVLHLAFFISITACCLNLLALTVDRYIAVSSPMLSRNKLGVNRSIILSISIWSVSGLVSLAYLKFGYINYLMIFANGLLLVTLVILTVLYVAVHRALAGHEKELSGGMSHSRRRVSISLELRQKKVTRVFLIVIVLFFICTVPAEVSIYVIKFCSVCSCTLIHVLRDLQLLFVLSTSAMNPFLCTLRLPTFKLSLYRLAGQIWSHRCCKGKRNSSNTTPEPSGIERNAFIFTEAEQVTLRAFKCTRPESASPLELHAL